MPLLSEMSFTVWSRSFDGTEVLPAPQLHAPVKPVLVFVSSRRQTRLTALDLLAYAAADERPRQFVHMPEHELEQALAAVKVRPVPSGADMCRICS